MYEGKEARSQFIVAGGYSAKLLELEEEFLYKMAFLIQPPVDIPRVGIVFFRRYAKIRVVVGNVFAQGPFAVCPVREHRGSFQADSAEQFLRNCDVASVASRQ